MIVLLTDFGFTEYVGVIKGVILQNSPDEKIVDLCHTVSPQNIVEGSWILSRNYLFFPIGSVFLCVVDPGVGSKRKIVAVKTKDYYFVAPDNGLLVEAVAGKKTEVRIIPVPKGASMTFHGRDVMAKAAADIALGGFDKIGKLGKGLEKLELKPRGRRGMIVRIDNFGNVVTNLKPLDKKKYKVEIGVLRFEVPFYPTYSSAKDGLFCIIGSSGTLELSVKNGSAKRELGVAVGAEIGLK